MFPSFLVSPVLIFLVAKGNFACGLKVYCNDQEEVLITTKAQLTCSYNSSDIITSFAWERKGNIIATLNLKSNETFISERYNMLHEGTLIIENVNLQDSGNYSFYVTTENSYESDFTNLITKRIPSFSTVQAPTDDVSSHPEIVSRTFHPTEHQSEGGSSSVIIIVIVILVVCFAVAVTFVFFVIKRRRGNVPKTKLTQEVEKDDLEVKVPLQQRGEVVTEKNERNDLVTDKHVERLAPKFPDDNVLWKTFVTQRLNIPSSALTESNAEADVVKKRTLVLKKWMEINRETATLQKLADCIDHKYKDDEVNKIVRTLIHDYD